MKRNPYKAGDRVVLDPETCGDALATFPTLDADKVYTVLCVCPTFDDQIRILLPSECDPEDEQDYGIYHTRFVPATMDDAMKIVDRLVVEVDEANAQLDGAVNRAAWAERRLDADRWLRDDLQVKIAAARRALN